MRLHFASGSLALAVAALLAGCGGQQVQSGAPTAVGVSPAAPVALTMPHYVPQPVHADRGKSWMSPDANQIKELLYVGDWATEDVFVYDYKSGKAEGKLTGFTEPYGMCVDAKGDVYIAEFGAGDAVEYAHGGTSPLNTYGSGGEPIGCSVDKKGDVAVTSFDPGEAVVYAGGNPSKGTTYSSCAEYQWTMGYDKKGNLIGVGYGSVPCGLLSGATSITTLSTSGNITIDFPGGTMWDGKYIALGDQEAGGTYEFGVWPSALSGSTLSSSGEVTFSSSCNNGYSEDVNAFILGRKNTPVNDQRAKVVVGFEDCTGYYGIAFWHYPQGGTPFRTLNTVPAQPYGLAVSIST